MVHARPKPPPVQQSADPFVEQPGVPPKSLVRGARSSDAKNGRAPDRHPHIVIPTLRSAGPRLTLYPTEEPCQCVTTPVSLCCHWLSGSFERGVPSGRNARDRTGRPNIGQSWPCTSERDSPVQEQNGGSRRCPVRPEFCTDLGSADTGNRYLPADPPTLPEPTISLPADLLEEHLGADRLERDVPLAPMTTFRVGGPADLLYRARTPDELATAVTAAREAGIEWHLLGAGANILVADRGVRGLVIRNEVAGIQWLDDRTVRAGAGVQTFPDLIVETVERGMGGLHHYVGIPSTVGGALWQNLHFLSPDRERTCFIAEVVAAAEILTEEGEWRTVDRDYFEFGYDDSILHHRDDVVLTADFRLEPASTEDLREVMRENLRWRDDRHPDLWLYPSAGSIFQKIEGVGAGRLIDECGLKGHVHGRAGIFHRHANIIVNLGGATAAEIRYLIDLARDTVFRETGYTLETEIGMLGEFDTPSTAAHSPR